jgi:hypothetical protein
VVLHRGRVAQERVREGGFAAAEVRALYEEALRDG